MVLYAWVYTYCQDRMSSNFGTSVCIRSDFVYAITSDSCCAVPIFIYRPPSAFPVFQCPSFLSKEALAMANSENLGTLQVGEESVLQ